MPTIQKNVPVYKLLSYFPTFSLIPSHQIVLLQTKTPERRVFLWGVHIPCTLSLFFLTKSFHDLAPPATVGRELSMKWQ